MSNIGYRKPPKHTQFKKGQSGNPKGRPKTKKPHDALSYLYLAFCEEIYRRVSIVEGGKRRKESMGSVVIKASLNKCIKTGDLKPLMAFIRSIPPSILEQQHMAKHVRVEDVHEKLMRALDAAVDRKNAEKSNSPALSPQEDK